MFVDGIGVNKVNFFPLKPMNEPKVFLGQGSDDYFDEGGGNFLVTGLPPDQKKSVEA